MKNKTIPLPCTEEQYKTVKMFCLMNNLKYHDLTLKLIKLIKEETKKENKIE